MALTNEMLFGIKLRKVPARSSVCKKRREKVLKCLSSESLHLDVLIVSISFPP